MVDQLREVVKAREAAIAQLSNEQKQAGLMLEAVPMERARLRPQVPLQSGLHTRSLHARDRARRVSALCFLFTQSF